MGAVPASGDLVVVRIKSTVGGEPTINGLSFQILNPSATWPDQVTATAALVDQTLGIQLGGAWVVARSTAFNSFEIEVVDAWPNTSPLGATVVSGQGAVEDDVMPPNDSLCITLRTDVKGRTGRGRIYLNGYTEGSSNGGYWEASAQDNGTAIAEALLSGFGAAAVAPDIRWGVISRYEFGVKRDIPAFTPINSFTVHNEVRSLRRRAIGVRISRRPAA